MVTLRKGVSANCEPRGRSRSGEVRFAIPERQMNFGFVANGVNNVSRAE